MRQDTLFIGKGYLGGKAREERGEGRGMGGRV